MPYSYNHSPHQNSWLFCRPLRGLRYPFYTPRGSRPGLPAVAPCRGLFSSAPPLENEMHARASGIIEPGR